MSRSDWPYSRCFLTLLIRCMPYEKEKIFQPCIHLPLHLSGTRSYEWHSYPGRQSCVIFHQALRRKESKRLFQLENMELEGPSDYCGPVSWSPCSCVCVIIGCSCIGGGCAPVAEVMEPQWHPMSHLESIPWLPILFLTCVVKSFPRGRWPGADK
jgi:hypothetical protein